MLFKGLLGTQMSGSIDGVVASRNRFGSYFRNRAMPVNPNTPQQSTVRQVFADLAVFWNQLLTPAERAAWIVYGANVPVINKIGESINLTGLNWYIALNTSRIQAGLTRLDAAPTSFTILSPGFGGAFSLAAPTDLSVAFTPGDWGAAVDGTAITVLVGLPQNPSIKFYGGPFRFVGAILGDSGTPPTSPQVLTTPFVFTAGQRVFTQHRVIASDGRVSPPFRTNFLAT